MTDPKRKLLGTNSLGKALDERNTKRTGALDIRHTTGAASPMPLGSSGAGAGSTSGAFYTPVATKSAAYTATVGDCVILCSGTWTLALPAASAATGLHLMLRNNGAGTITLDPDASEQIEVATTYALNAGNAVHVVCDGSAWWIVANL